MNIQLPTNTSTMFTKILIANRGEIACRIIKTAKKMGISTVAVYSNADENALHVKMADEAVYIGKSPSRESYLQPEKIIQAALITGAKAIHPGYGFLSENANFCRLCDQNNITFIGPSISAIELMGSKSAAKTIMEQANVPLVPGYHGDDQSEHVIKAAADNMGYPVLLKATAGGGGKGMRQIWHSDEFSEGFEAVKREALSSFGNDTMLVEKYLTQPRHVEIQIFCDNHGNAVFLFERDCSVQRRHQKVIEEAPAFGMTESLRNKMGEAAIKSAQAIGYQGAGTVEFLLDVDGSFYFMEMNTRLQVEHPVTEFITKQDLVEWQLRVAANEILPKKQNELSIHGHAFEARIYAEDTTNNFLPDTGILSFIRTPIESEFVRIDTGVCEHDEVSVFYDPMIAKLIVWGENREKALQRLTKALSEYNVGGVKTNISFLRKLVTSQPFIDEQIDTSFIDKHHDNLFNSKEITNTHETLTPITLIQAALFVLIEQKKTLTTQYANKSDFASPWNSHNAWQLNDNSFHNVTLMTQVEEHNVTHNITIEETVKNNVTEYSVAVNNATFLCSAELSNGLLINTINGYKSQIMAVKNNQQHQVTLFTHSDAYIFIHVKPDLGDRNNNDYHGGLVAPMNGTIIKILISSGEHVEQNEPLLIIESMKMEHSIKAPNDGVVDAIYCKEGDMITGNTELLAFTASKNKSDSGGAK